MTATAPTPDTTNVVGYVPPIVGQPAPGTFAASTDTGLMAVPANPYYGALTTTGLVTRTTPQNPAAFARSSMDNGTLTQSVFVDASGHVTSPVGTRVGGVQTEPV